MDQVDGEIVVDLMKVSKHSDTPKGMTMRGNVTEFNGINGRTNNS
jgi:hypothetical protein